MWNCLMVAVGGAIGAVFRYLIGLIPLEAQSGFPFKTLVINIAGSFVIGVIAVLAQKQSLSPSVVMLLKTGVCGGFTTFSTFALESNQLISSGNYMFAAIYMCASVLLSVAAVFAAQILVQG